MKNRYRLKGQAAILIIFTLGMVAVLIAISQVKLGSLESFRGRVAAASLQAFYAANSGVEDTIQKLKVDGTITTNTLTVDDYDVDVSVTGGDGGYEIESIASNGVFARRIRVTTQNTSFSPGLSYAVHAGQGGFEIENNAEVNGGVYSKSDISGGSSNSSCGGNPAIIRGIATASGTLTNLNGTGNGVCVTEDAYATLFDYCYIQGTANYINSPVNCSNSPLTNEITEIETVEFPITDVLIQMIADQIVATPYNGDCYVGGPNDTPDCYDISSGIPTIGNAIILGNLEISTSQVNFSGPVWVKHVDDSDLDDDFQINSNTTIGLTSDLTEVSQMLIVDGKIKIRSNLTFVPNTSSTPGKKIYLLPISRYPLDTISDVCVQDNIDTTVNSIYIQSNVNDVIFFAPHGCLFIKGVGGGLYFGSAIGEKVFLGGGTLTYDSELFDAVFGSTSEGGWKIMSFEEF